MTEKETILTAEGLVKLEAELEELRTVKRLENEERLKEAISHGDLSENSEYDSAKDEQARIEGRILELEQMVKTAKVIDNTKKRKTKVELGATVFIEDMAPEFEEDREPVSYTHLDVYKRQGKGLADKGCADGLVVVAEEQSGGKGRLSRGWFSPRGGGVWCLSLIHIWTKRRYIFYEIWVCRMKNA